MKKLCIIGAGGLLGGRLIAAAKGSFSLSALDLHVPAEKKTQNIPWYEADITNGGQLKGLLTSLACDCIINTAAVTDVDYCEDDPDTARRVNTEGAGNVAAAAAACGAQLIHLSTDYVFDGLSGPYTEKDIPNPISVYGQTKYDGEGEVLNAVPEAVIARTMILFGAPHGNKSNFVTWLIHMLKNGKSVRIVNDQYGSPTHADDLAGALLALLESGETGLFHTAGPDVLNRYDFALRIAEIFNLDRSLITETDSSAFVQKAPRPKKSGLISHKITGCCGYRFASLERSLKQMKQNMEGA